MKRHPSSARRRVPILLVILLALLVDGVRADTANEEQAVRKIITEYGRAIEGKDLALFKGLKPNITKEEEERLRRAFESVKTQEVKISVESVELGTGQATVKVKRRDVIDRSLVASFVQTLVLVRNDSGWVIRDISR